MSRDKCVNINTDSLILKQPQLADAVSFDYSVNLSLICVFVRLGWDFGGLLGLKGALT